MGHRSTRQRTREKGRVRAHRAQGRARRGGEGGVGKGWARTRGDQPLPVPSGKGGEGGGGARGKRTRQVHVRLEPHLRSRRCCGGLPLLGAGWGGVGGGARWWPGPPGAVCARACLGGGGKAQHKTCDGEQGKERGQRMRARREGCVMCGRARGGERGGRVHTHKTRWGHGRRCSKVRGTRETGEKQTTTQPRFTTLHSKPLPRKFQRVEAHIVDKATLERTSSKRPCVRLEPHFPTRMLLPCLLNPSTFTTDVKLCFSAKRPRARGRQRCLVSCAIPSTRSPDPSNGSMGERGEVKGPLR